MKICLVTADLRLASAGAVGGLLAELATGGLLKGVLFSNDVTSTTIVFLVACSGALLCTSVRQREAGFGPCIGIIILNGIRFLLRPLRSQL